MGVWQKSWLCERIDLSALLSGMWCAKAWSQALKTCGITSSQWTSDSTSCAILTWMWILLSHWMWSKTTRTSTITLSNPMKSELLWMMKAAGCRQINLAWLSSVTSCTHGSTCWCCHTALLLFPERLSRAGGLCADRNSVLLLVTVWPQSTV